MLISVRQVDGGGGIEEKEGNVSGIGRRSRLEWTTNTRVTGLLKSF